MHLHRTLRRALIAVIASISVAATVTSATAAAGPEAPGSPRSAAVRTVGIVPGSLPRGAAPAADVLIGNTLRPAGGRAIALPRSWRPGQAQLVGRVRGAWLVQRNLFAAGRGQLFRVTRSGVRLLDEGAPGSGSLDWYLSSEDTHVVRIESDGYGGCWVRVMSPTGTSLAHRGCAYDANLVGGSGTTVYYTPFAADGTVAWDWSTTARPTSTGVVGEFADPAHDLLFLHQRGMAHPGGPTSLADPGAPAWRADFHARAVSPDGRYVVGRAGRLGQGDVEIRKVADGMLLQRFHVRGGGDIWWESATKVLLSATAKKSWLVRCSVWGSCHTAAGPVARGWDYTHRHVPVWHEQPMP